MLIMCKTPTMTIIGDKKYVANKVNAPLSTISSHLAKTYNYVDKDGNEWRKIEGGIILHDKEGKRIV